MTAIIFLFVAAAYASSTCSRIGLWPVRSGDTVVRGSRALGFRDYTDFTQCDDRLGQDPSHIDSDETYTVPYVPVVESSASWRTVSGTHFLVLRGAATQEASSSTSVISKPTGTTLQTKTHTSAKVSSHLLSSSEQTGPSTPTPKTTTTLSTTNAVSSSQDPEQTPLSSSQVSLSSWSEGPQSSSDSSIMKGTTSAAEGGTSVLQTAPSETTPNHQPTKTSEESNGNIICYELSENLITTDEMQDNFATDFCFGPGKIPPGKGAQDVVHAYFAKNNNDRGYLFSIHWIEGCQVEEKYSDIASEACKGIMRANYKGCIDLGQGGYVMWNCRKYSFRPLPWSVV